MRILICGGREWPEGGIFKKLVFDHLDSLFPSDAHHDTSDYVNLVIEGEATGIDTLGRMWALNRGVKVARFPADWKKYGKAAGFKRNEQMLKEGKPDLVVAFPGGKGTKMMIELAREAGVDVVETVLNFGVIHHCNPEGRY